MIAFIGALFEKKKQGRSKPFAIPDGLIGGGSGATLAEIEASTVLAKRSHVVAVNEGVKKASLAIPYSGDLPA
jgi:hypothetical protein